ADALALVGLGRTHAADPRRPFADPLLVDARHRDAVAGFDRELDARRRLELDGMGEAHLDDDPAVRRRLGAVAHPLNLEALGEPLGHARDHVRHQRAGEPVQRLELALLAGAGHLELAVGARHLAARRDRPRQLALRALHAHLPIIDGDLDVLRQGNRRSSDSRHDLAPGRLLSRPYQTWQSTSPPTPSRRACSPVITPRGVDRMEVPTPPYTRGMSAR